MTHKRIPGANLDNSRAYFGVSRGMEPQRGGYWWIYRSNTDKLTFSSETTSAFTSISNFSVPSRQKSMAQQAILSSGYFCGGNPTSKSIE